MRCPRCSDELVATVCDRGKIHACSTCAGCAVTVEMLRRLAPKDRVNRAWRQAREHHDRSALTCPECGAAMRMVHLAIGTGDLALDACAVCHVVWFDQSELATFAPASGKPTAEERVAAIDRLGLGRDEEPVMSDELWRVFSSLGNVLS